MMEPKLEFFAIDASFREILHDGVESKFHLFLSKHKNKLQILLSIDFVHQTIP